MATQPIKPKRKPKRKISKRERDMELRLHLYEGMMPGIHATIVFLRDRVESLQNYIVEMGVEPESWTKHTHDTTTNVVPFSRKSIPKG